MQHRWLQWALRLLATTVIMLGLLTQLNVQELQRVLVAPAVSPLLGMIVVAWLFVFLGGIKFWVLYRALTPVPFASFIRYFVVATSLGTFTPASLGDFSLAALLRREHIAVCDSMSVLVLDRVLTMSLYAAVFLPLTLGLLLHVTHVWWVPAGLLVSGTLVVALNAATPVRHLVRCTLMHSRLAWLVSFLAAISTLLRQHPWRLLGNTVLTLLRCVMAGVVVQLALWAAGEWQPFVPVLYTTNAISVLNLLPVSFAGLGVYESGGVAILSQLGFDRERVFTAFVYQRLYVILSSLLILLVSRAIVTRIVPAKEEQS
jgi:uncharacterized membrane protein YbhN (UPF0104 family)